jgi:hypothetical protein
MGIWMANVILAFLLGMLLMEQMSGRRFLVSASVSRMVYPRAGPRAPYGRSMVVEVWTGGERP